MSKYAKAVTTALGIALTVAVTYYPHASWIPIATALGTVLGVYAVPNAGTRDKMEVPIKHTEIIP